MNLNNPIEYNHMIEHYLFISCVDYANRGENPRDMLLEILDNKLVTKNMRMAANNLLPKFK